MICYITSQIRRGRGFTLLEIILAIVLLLAIASAAFAMIDYVARVRAGVRELQAATRQRDVLLTTLERALIGAVANDAANSVTFTGSQSELTIPTRTWGGGDKLILRFEESSGELLAAWDGQTPTPILTGYVWCELSYFDRGPEFEPSITSGLPRAIKIAAGKSGDSTSSLPDFLLVVSVLDGGGSESDQSTEGVDRSGQPDGAL